MKNFKNIEAQRNIRYSYKKCAFLTKGRFRPRFLVNRRGCLLIFYVFPAPELIRTPLY